MARWSAWSSPVSVRTRKRTTGVRITAGKNSLATWIKLSRGFSENVAEGSEQQPLELDACGRANGFSAQGNRPIHVWQTDALSARDGAACSHKASGLYSPSIHRQTAS